jgi:DNA-binding Lrp family transcriptional regulator
MELDRFDWQILQALQQDARSTHQKLAQQIPLSASQIGRRLQRMEENGVVQGYQVNILPDRIGLSVMAFAHVSLERHNESALREFAQAIHALPEVLECYATAGEADYLLRIVVETCPRCRAL